jgi:hypothetical protein
VVSGAEGTRDALLATGAPPWDAATAALQVLVNHASDPWSAPDALAVGRRLGWTGSKPLLALGALGVAPEHWPAAMGDVGLTAADPVGWLGGLGYCAALGTGTAPSPATLVATAGVDHPISVLLAAFELWLREVFPPEDLLAVTPGKDFWMREWDAACEMGIPLLDRLGMALDWDGGDVLYASPKAPTKGASERSLRPHVRYEPTPRPNKSEGTFTIPRLIPCDVEVRWANPDPFSLALPKGLEVTGDLHLKGGRLEPLPEGLRVGGNLRLERCGWDGVLPPDLRVGGGIFRDGVRLRKPKAVPSFRRRP